MSYPTTKKVASVAKMWTRKVQPRGVPWKYACSSPVLSANQRWPRSDGSTGIFNFIFWSFQLYLD